LFWRRRCLGRNGPGRPMTSCVCLSYNYVFVGGQGWCLLPPKCEPFPQWYMSPWCLVCLGLLRSATVPISSGCSDECGASAWDGVNVPAQMRPTPRQTRLDLYVGIRAAAVVRRHNSARCNRLSCAVAGWQWHQICVCIKHLDPTILKLPVVLIFNCRKKLTQQDPCSIHHNMRRCL
jgi:hypothetical protein